MNETIIGLYRQLPLFILPAVILLFLYTLSKGADILIDTAVKISARTGLSRGIIGATLVSLGTTLPEASVSLYSAANGKNAMAIGNALGSIICNSTLILGCAAMVKPFKLEKNVVKKQTIFLLIIIVTTFTVTLFTDLSLTANYLPRWMAAPMTMALAWFIYDLFKGNKNENQNNADNKEAEQFLRLAVKLLSGLTIIIISSRLMLPAAELFAGGIGIPAAIIAMTLVAFGTSLPELATAITAAKHGYGDLALGNVLGANILNMLFVVNGSVMISPQPFHVDSLYLNRQFPLLIAAVLLLAAVVLIGKNSLNRGNAALLLVFYSLYNVGSFLFF